MLFTHNKEIYPLIDSYCETLCGRIRSMIGDKPRKQHVAFDNIYIFCFVSCCSDSEYNDNIYLFTRKLYRDLFEV